MEKETYLSNRRDVLVATQVDLLQELVLIKSPSQLYAELVINE